MSRAAVDKNDRYFSDAKTTAEGPVGDLDLEAIAFGVDAIQIEALEDTAMEAFEAAGQIVYRQTESMRRLSEPEDDTSVQAAPGR